MCILRVRRYVEEDGRTLETSSSWVICENGNLRESCPNYQRREQLIRVPIGSTLSSPGLMPHDNTSSSASSMPGTPTSGPRFDIREPFKNSVTGNPIRHGNFFNRPPSGRHPSRDAAPRPILSQPNPPHSGGRLNRVPLPSGIRDHRRAYSDSEYEERMSIPNSSDRATEILDRNAAREAARRERRRADDIRRREEEREERETALDEEERRTQQRLQGRERLREIERQKQHEENLRREREDREAREREEIIQERQRKADRERIEQLKREIKRDKEQERRRKEREEEEEKHRRELEELLEEESIRKARKAHLERELRYYQDLEARLDLAERRRAEEEEFSRHAQEIEAARRARESRKAENARQQRTRQAELDTELQRLKDLERRLNAAKRLRQQYVPRTPPAYVQPPPLLPSPRGGTHPFITQGRPLSHTLESLLQQQPSSILNEHVRRAHGENVLDQARQDAELLEEAEYRVPLRRRNTIGGRERERETQYRSMRRYPS